MTVEQILQTLETADFAAWDKKTVKEAVRMREELAPVLLENQEQYYQKLLDPDWDPDDAEYYIHINGCHLLGELKETRAYPILLKYMVLPEQQLDYAFGDDLLMDIPKVMAKVYDGSLEETKAIIEDTQVYEFARGALIKVLGYVCLDGRIPQEAYVQFLKEILQKEQDLDNEGIVVCVMEIVYETHLFALCPDVRDMMLSGGIPPVEYADFLDRLFDYSGAKKEKWVPVAFREPAAAAAADGLTAEEVAILGYNAGRNDPCPCGSGKKFKKCCGPKQDALRYQHPNYTVKHSEQSLQSQTVKMDPVLYPPIEGSGGNLGLADYFPREGIDVDLHAYRGMHLLSSSSTVTRTEAKHRVAVQQLWEAFEGFQKICQEQEFQDTVDYDRVYAVHYPCSTWLMQLADLLQDSGDSRLKTVKKWL